jgi:hypothetical protein
MPVHINEIVIRAVVGGDAGRQQRPPAENGRPDREQIVAECVEQVMALLEERQER